MTLPNLTMVKGDTVVFPLTLYGDDAEPLDLTGLELSFNVKRYLSDTDLFIQKTLGDGIAVVDAEDGTITVTIDGTDTDDVIFWSFTETMPYSWDVQTLDDYEQVRTRRRGTLLVYRDISAAVVP